MTGIDFGGLVRGEKEWKKRKKRGGGNGVGVVFVICIGFGGIYQRRKNPDFVTPPFFFFPFFFLGEQQYGKIKNKKKVIIITITITIKGVQNIVAGMYKYGQFTGNTDTTNCVALRILLLSEKEKNNAVAALYCTYIVKMRETSLFWGN